jgi:serine O-acetyltransferase
VSGDLARDLRRSYSLTAGSRLRRLIELYRSPGIHAVITFRFGQWIRERPLLVRMLLKPLHALQNHRMMAKWGIMIQPGARIDGGLHIFHFGGIFIGEQVKIGRDFSLSHDVTIGLAGEGPRRGAPVIGDNVYVAPGAKVYGKIQVGNNVRIGANAVVDRSVPANALVQVARAQMVTFPGLYGRRASTGDTGGLDQ